MILLIKRVSRGRNDKDSIKISKIFYSLIIPYHHRITSVDASISLLDKSRTLCKMVYLLLNYNATAKHKLNTIAFLKKCIF